MENGEKLKCRDSVGRMVENTWKKLRHITFEDIVLYFYRPTDPSSLGIIRCLFGFLMLLDLSEERGGSIIDIRWGNPQDSFFRLLLTSGQIDYIIIHWFGFLLDLTIGFWMLVEFTRPVAMLFCACFHLMNSRLFSIGMFPYVCLATMPLFCDETWPRKIQSLFTTDNLEAAPSDSCIYPKDETRIDRDLVRKPSWKHKFVATLLMCHCGLQAFLPYSHFITKGYNNWTNGLYGYSWDMMVHSWDTILVVVKVIDNDTDREHFIDAGAWTHNDRWSKHADMGVQYAQCLKKNLIAGFEGKSHLGHSTAISSKFTSDNISIYLDVWCSLNKRFQQRMFDPNYDLLKANWSPFQPVEWLLPVLWQYSDFRKKMDEISKEVHSWSNDSDVLFIADFPGLFLENFINEDFDNVTLTIMEGEVVYEVEIKNSLQSVGVKLSRGQSTSVEVGIFHKIHTISKTPSCYMYTFTRTSKEDEKEPTENKRSRRYSPFPLIEDIGAKVKSAVSMWGHFVNSVLYILFGKPYDIRTIIKNDEY
nr:vitamin K-dependent gamma-carboxylase [Leptinotarsa decemlineata]